MNVDRQSRWLIVNYAATIFISAFLLFQVQPLISRYILPWFGGSPAVWTTCMLFFQSALFAGYAYAHAINRLARPKWQGVAHVALLGGALLLAHIEPSPSWKPLDGGLPTWRILMLLSACVGMPYFVLATTGPLLQAWFSHHYPGRSPYRLYALSNLGSLIALLSYPFLFEPTFELGQQATMWFWGYTVFVVLCAYLASLHWRTGNAAGEAYQPARVADVQAAAGVEVDPALVPDSETSGAAQLAAGRLLEPPPTWWRCLLWLALPAFGSYMLLATTNHVCQDVAVIPFLWVVPLSVYLLSFIISFDHPRWYRRGLYAIGAIVCIYAVGFVYDMGLGESNLYSAKSLGTGLHVMAKSFTFLFRWGASPPKTLNVDIGFLVALVLHFAALFFICMMCHGELVRLRPPSRHLTAYYLMISAGGALGGIFVSLIAPHLFVTYFEWNMGIVGGYALATCLLLHSLATTLLRYVVRPDTRTAAQWVRVLLPVGSLLLVVVDGAGLFDLIGYASLGRKVPVFAARNFYGTVSVREKGRNNPNEDRYELRNGSILHGVQFLAPKKRRLPTTYYARQSGVGRAIEFLDGQRQELRIGTVGLGAGTLAAYGRPGDTLRFYEINPAVIELAQSGRLFTYLSGCPGKVEVVPGDARLSLERESPQHYHVLALDAFSGDAIPTHLLTREAFELYRRHIATRESDGIDGVIAIHISNRYLNLRPVVLAGAQQLNLQTIQIDNEGDEPLSVNRSRWMLLTRNEQLLKSLKSYASERPTPNDGEPAEPEEIVTWTDAYSALWGILIR